MGSSSSSPSPKLAKDIIADIIREVSPDRHELLQHIVEIEDNHLSDKGATAAPLIAAEIERAAKLEAPRGL